MKIIENNIIPFKGYKIINLFGVIFLRKNTCVSSIDMNHEAIHTAQMKEMLYIFFYVWYIIEWLVRVVFYNKNSAYRKLSFEVEAYKFQENLDYLKYRKHFTWINYL